MFAMGGKQQEEFKMMEGDEDSVDLLDEKSKSSNLNEFYAQNEQLDDLKNSLMGMSLNISNGHGQQTNNNTEAGETESSEH